MLEVYLDGEFVTSVDADSVDFVIYELEMDTDGELELDYSVEGQVLVTTIA